MREHKRLFKFNIKYLIIFIILLIVEALIALYIDDNFIRPLIGDIIVMALMYTFIKSFINTKTKFLPLYLLAFAFAVELSQGLGLVEMLGLSEYRLARIVLGTTFDKHDLLAYTIGSGVLIIWDRKKFEFILALVISNIWIYTFALNYFFGEIGVSVIYRSLLIFLFILFLIITFIVMNIKPSFKKYSDNTRINILMSGRKLIRISYALLFVNLLWVIFFRDITNEFFLNTSELSRLLSVTTNFILGFLVLLVFYINGYLRIVITSRRLSSLKRLIIGLFIFIPPVQLVFSYYLCNRAITEFEHESYKVNMDKVRVESQICETKYPLLMLHGVGFKDYKYVNYWGRIPNELIKHGSTVYYGHQEAWGTIEHNGQEIKDRIKQILLDENCDKVNIIAHSKGGLDARYVVSQLGMGKHVASLTLISVPNRGSEVLEFVYKYLPNGLVNIIGNGINKYFVMLGDDHPDFHKASQQFLLKNSTSFNQKVIDDPNVYYQSYASLMKSPLSDLLLAIPYIIVRAMGGKNDGLVTVESSKWGDFKGVIKNKYNRGVSHGDTIDLKREDYEGFDVREFYVQRVHELKQAGF